MIASHMDTHAQRPHGRASSQRGRTSYQSHTQHSARPARGGYGGRTALDHRGSSQRSGRPNHSRGGGFGSRGGRSNRYKDRSFFDVSKFINKAVDEVAQIYQPEHAFTDFPLEATLKTAIAKKGYITPTPIQDKAIMHVLHGHDVVGLANTGTGKTAAFLIPLINKVLLDKKQSVLVVVPTRELAQQIEEELRSLTRGMGIVSVTCVGGANIGPQIRALRSRNNFVIGTPGRIKDLIERNVLNLGYFNTIVLDEADRMLDMGFIHDIRYMMERMPENRHTLFFSATVSREIEGLISQFLNNPTTISVRTRDTSKAVDQDVVYVQSGEKKIDVLAQMLQGVDFYKVLIFGKTKYGVENLSHDLRALGIKAESIHGNKSQSQRQRALKHFKDNVTQVLIATDVAARGLDIPDVSHVINYELPATYEDYIHRIGRTGRAGKTGKALTFVQR